jgi:hypothetical protein
MRIFITYDRNDAEGQRAALRIQTVGSVHGLEVELPYRVFAPHLLDALHPETVARIQRADFVVWMSGAFADSVLQAELRVAMAAHRPILALYNWAWQAQPSIQGYEAFTAVGVSGQDQDMVGTITRFAEEHLKAESKKKRKEGVSALVGLALVGAGLWALSKTNK